MPSAALPPDELQRLDSLYRYELLDTLPEESFDRICRMAAQLCRTPIALISLLDRDRQFFKSSLGLPVRETERSTSFCAHAILDDRTLVIEDATKDERVRDLRLVLGKPWIRFYAGEPLRAADGSKLGTLCVIDVKARAIAPEELAALRTLAREVEAHFELRRTNAELARQLAQRQRIAQSVVHDMSDPLTAMEFALSELRELSEPSEAQTSESARVAEVTSEMAAAAHSLRRLVTDLRDFGVGVQADLAPRWQRTALVPIALNVCDLARPGARRRSIDIQCETPDAAMVIECDPDLVRRVLENLVFNAVDYVPDSSDVVVRLVDAPPDHIELCVEHEGPSVGPSAKEPLFDLYGWDRQPGQRIARGIGLGFCRTAARAQGGEVEIRRRDPRGSVFALRLARRKPG